MLTFINGVNITRIIYKKNIKYNVYSLDRIPPEATIVSPVIYAASSLAKNAATPAISFGSPNLCIGICDNVTSPISPSQSYEINSMT